MATNSEYRLKENGEQIESLFTQIAENEGQIENLKVAQSNAQSENSKQFLALQADVELLRNTKMSNPDVPKSLLPYSDGQTGVTWKYPEDSEEYELQYIPGYFYNSNGETKHQVDKTFACNPVPITVKAGKLAIIDTKNYYVQAMFTANGEPLKNVAVNVNNASTSGLIKDSFMVIPTHDYDLELYLRVAKDAGHSAEFSAEEVEQIDVEVRTLKPTANCIIQGNVFIFIANGQIHVETTSTFRCSFSGAYLVHQNKKVSFPKPTSGTFFICMDKEGFYLRNLTFLTAVDFPVAYYYSDKIFSLGYDGIICNSVPITDWYQRENIPIFINNKKLKFTLDNRINQPYVDNFGYFYKVQNGFNYTGGNLFFYSNSAGLKLTTDSVVKRNSVDISGKKILTIGDSITRRGWYQQQIKNHVPTVEFVGTQTAYYNGIKCEGYSGLKSENVLKDATLKLSDGTIIDNPFYNPATGKIDFSYYCESNDISADYVIIEFGLNETSSKNYNTYIRSFINSIKSHNSATVVYVVQPFGETDGAAFNKKTANHRRAFEECVLESYKFEDCVKIPAYFIMIDEYDYEPAELDYGYDNVSVLGTSDGVHPKEQTGFAKLGDMIYNWLGIS